MEVPREQQTEASLMEVAPDQSARTEAGQMAQSSQAPVPGSDRSALAAEKTVIGIYSKKTKKTQWALQREVFFDNDLFKENTVYVSGFPRHTPVEQIKALFPDLSVTHCEVTHLRRSLSAFVRFSDRKDVGVACQMSGLKIGHHQIHVTVRPHDEHEDNYYFDNDKIKTALNKCVSIDEQLAYLQQEFQAPTEQREQAKEIREQVEGVLQDFFPGVQVCQYGAGTSGPQFNLRSNTVNFVLIINCDQDNTTLEDFPRREMPEVSENKSLTLVDGKYTWESIRGMTEGDTHKFINKILKKHCTPALSNFSLRNPPGSKEPAKTTMSHELGYRVTYSLDRKLLLRFRYHKCMSLIDDRVTPLMYALHYWYHCSPANAEVRLDTMQALLMTYLATIKPAIIPTVSHMQQVMGGEDGQSLELNPGQLNWKYENTGTLTELLIGFFVFISKIDFDRHAVNSHTGEIMTRVDYDTMRNKTSTNHEFLIVSDTLLPKNNLMTVLTGKKRDDFVMDVLVRYDKSKHEKFSREEGRDWGISFLFNVSDEIQRVFAMGNQMLQYKVNLLESSVYSFPVNIPSNILVDPTLPDNFTDRWLTEITEFLNSCLREVLLMKVDEVLHLPLGKVYTGTHGYDILRINKNLQRKAKSKKRKAEEANMADGAGDEKKIKTDPDVTMEPVEPVVGAQSEAFDPEPISAGDISCVQKCIEHYRVWQGRKVVKNQVAATEALSKDKFTLEKQISDHIKRTWRPNIDSVIEFYVSFVTNDDNTQVHVNFYPTVGIREFKCFFMFAKPLLTQLIQRSFTMDMSGV